MSQQPLDPSMTAAAQAPVTVPQHSGPGLMQPPVYMTNHPSNPSEKPLPITQTAAPVVLAAAAPAGADNAVSGDAIRMAYMQYITIQLKEATPGAIPAELAQRGLSQQQFASILTQVKQIKSKSNTNKCALWTGCIFCCGIIGYLLVSQRAVGNKPLRKQLETPLEDENRKLMAAGVPVRWVWIDGSLRGYYK